MSAQALFTWIKSWIWKRLIRLLMLAGTLALLGLTYHRPITLHRWVGIYLVVITMVALTVGASFDVGLKEDKADAEE